jgi:hypothetical protein
VPQSLEQLHLAGEPTLSVRVVDEVRPQDLHDHE